MKRSFPTLPSLFVCAVLLGFPLSFPPSAFPEEPPGYPAYWGGTGLMEIPTARVIADGSIRIGASHIHPYRYYYGTLGFLPGFEINGRVTEFLTVDVRRPGWEEYGKYKDKAFDAKYQIFEEGKYLPAVAVGLQDFTGTQLLTSNYLVFSKRIDRFDLTLGYGAGRLGGRILRYTGDFPQDMAFQSEGPFLQGLVDGLFAGVDAELHPRLSLIVEYNPIPYEEDRIRVVEKVRSRINVGLRGRPFDWLTLDVSFQRGEEIGLMLGLNYPLGKPFLPWKPDPPFMGPVNRRPLGEVSPREVVKRIEAYLQRQDFVNIRVSLVGREIFVEYENTKYLSQAKALGRVMRTVAAQSPEGTTRIHIIPKLRNVRMMTLSVQPDHVFHFINGAFTTEEFSRLLSMTPEISQEPEAEGMGSAETESRRSLKSRTGYGMKPTLETYWNDPSGFFKYRISIDGAVWNEPWTGGSLYLLGRVPVWNTVSSNVPPITEEPVRSDIINYKGDDPRIEYALFDQVFRLGEKVFGLCTLGYMDTEYAGLTTEVMVPLWEGRANLGAGASLVKKRKYPESFALEEPWYHTATLNTSYLFPGLDLQIEGRAGEFLAGDRGVRFDVTRHVRGASLSFWYTVTDMKDVIGGERYHDKGIRLTIPGNIFLQNDSRTRYSYATSPWTRDVGQLVQEWNRLTPFAFSLSPAFIRGHLDDLRN